MLVLAWQMSKCGLSGAYKYLSFIFTIGIWIPFLVQDQDNVLQFISVMVYSILCIIIFDKNPSKIPQLLLWNSILLFVMFWGIFFLSGVELMDDFPFLAVTINMVFPQILCLPLDKRS